MVKDVGGVAAAVSSTTSSTSRRSRRASSSSTRAEFDLRDDARRHAARPSACGPTRRGWSSPAASPPTCPTAGRRPGRLRQVLINLVGNAIKFTEKGEVSCRSSGGSGGPAGARRPALRRHGHRHRHPAGEAAAHLRGVRAGRRLDHPQYGGTGLGLAISAQLVELMGGRIGVESEPGRGSTLPLHGALRLPGPRARRGRGRPPTLRGLRVLVVDDNATNRRILEEMLRHWGCGRRRRTAPGEASRSCGSAARGRRAVRRSCCSTPDARHGRLHPRRADRQDPRLAGPVMMLTSGRARATRACRELGIAAYLTKPVKQSELLDTIRRSSAAAAAGRSAGGRPPPRASRPLAHPAGRGQRRQPAGGGAHAGEARARGGRREQRPRGGRGVGRRRSTSS